MGMLTSFFDEVEKLSAAKSNFSIPQSRGGRRPMRVETMLKKDKEGTLLKHKLGGAQDWVDENGEGFDDAVGVESVNGKKRVLEGDEARQELAEIEAQLPMPNAIFKGLSGLFNGEDEEESEKEAAGKLETYMPWYGAAAGGTGGAMLGTGIGLHSSKALDRVLDKKLSKEAEVKYLMGKKVKPHTEIRVRVTGADAAPAVERLLENVHKRGSTGHSFGIYEADGEGSKAQGELLGGWDGDGGALITSIERVPLEEKEKKAWSKLADSSKAQWLELPYTEGERAMQNAPVQSKKKPGDAPNVDSDSMNGPSKYDDGWSPPTTALAVKTGALARALAEALGDDGFGDAPDRDTPNPNRIQHQTDKNYFIGNAPDTRPLTEVESDGVYSRD